MNWGLDNLYYIIHNKLNIWKQRTLSYSLYYIKTFPSRSVHTELEKVQEFSCTVIWSKIDVFAIFYCKIPYKKISLLLSHFHLWKKQLNILFRIKQICSQSQRSPKRISKYNCYESYCPNGWIIPYIFLRKYSNIVE